MTISAERSATAPERGGSVPDFFIVGHPKSGTTALYEMLRRHPDIYMPELKETRFFAPELHPAADRSNNRPQTLEEYVSLFAAKGAAQRSGEASPSYLRSRTAAERIAAVRPDARLIALFREPASFLNSLHLELLRDQVETEGDLRKAMALEAERSKDSERLRSPGLVYSEYVRYVEQLRRYHAVFPREQMLILIYDDFRDDNEGTVKEVLRFLGVDGAGKVQTMQANPTVRVRSPRADKLVRSLYLGEGPLGRAAKATIKALTPERLRRDGLETFRRRVLYGNPRPPDQELTLELRRRFKGEVVALAQYLDRDLVTLWGYGNVA
jgi:hypothetical protein